jgi:hypothetical protein
METVCKKGANHDTKVTTLLILQEELERKIAEIRSERKVDAQKQKSVQPELVQVGSQFFWAIQRIRSVFALLHLLT